MAAPDDRAEGAPGRHETEKERLDRNLQDLLAGLRVALPGVQVLFAFLLILPFQDRFSDISTFQETVYFATLMLTAISSVLLIAPSARHRMRFRADDKYWVVVTGNQLGMIGLGTLGLAITGAVLLIASLIFATGPAVLAAAAVMSLLAWAWFVAPLLRRTRTNGNP